jgi:deoxyhypusine monooxygenase
VNEGEHGMVRHEAAEALGAIGREKETTLLEKYLTDSEGLVRESCEVALDAADYWSAYTAEGTAAQE